MMRDDRFGLYERHMHPDPDNLSDLSHDESDEDLYHGEWIYIPDDISDISAMDMDNTDSDDGSDEIYESDSEELKTLNVDNFLHTESSKVTVVTIPDGPATSNMEKDQAIGPSKPQWSRVNMTPDPDNLSDLSHDEEEEGDERIDISDDSSDISAIDMDDSDSDDDSSDESYESDSEKLKTLNVDNFLHTEISKVPVVTMPDGPTTTNVEKDQATGPSKPQWIRVYPSGMKQDITDCFTVKNVGPKNCPISNDPIDYFNLFFTKYIWTMMVEQTNVYAHSKKHELLSAGKLKDSRLAKWVDVTEKEMNKFIAILINMGTGRLHGLKEHWITRENFHLPFYEKTMPLERFHLILSMFHLSTSASPPKGELNYDPLIKIRNFINSMNETFKLYFVPGQVISVDESCFAKKNGKVQYTPTTNFEYIVEHRVLYGIKKFELFDCASRYVLHVSFISGKDFFKDRDTFNRKIVQELLTQAQCLGKGYHLMIKNYYKKIQLARWLLMRKTFLTGIVNKRSKDLCETIIKAPIKVGQFIYFRKNNVIITKYRKSKQIVKHFVTTAYNVDDWDLVTNKNTIKPSSIPRLYKSRDYLTSTRPTKRYWKKCFYSLLDTAIQNAYILFISQSGRFLDQDIFVLDLLDKLVDGPQSIDEFSSDDD